MISREEKTIKLQRKLDEIEKKKKKKKKLIKLIFIILILFLFITSLVSYMHFIGTTGLEVREYKIVNEKLPSNFHGFKIVQFSDLHYLSTIDKNDLKKIITKINKLKPDIVVFTGDLISNDVEISSNDINDLVELFNKITTTTGMYAIKGDNDYDNGYFDLIFNQTEFKIITNSSDLIYYHGTTPILITGVGSSIQNDMDVDTSFSNQDASLYNILLLHEADNIDTILNTNVVDLALSGHSHNGQIRLPGIGALTVVNGSKKYKNEYYKINDTDLYISGGIGTSGLKLRFFTKPSISIYRLVEK